ncbi:YMGG-like glycine zipper-containing protein [Fusobacterium sp. PH5-44]|uniref:YMGG-like glycine zipper-containing protein n=1 Tax=unclassified Fusobacterium TaxID=2648384 RepID=UPI003D1BFA76
MKKIIFIPFISLLIISGCTRTQKYVGGGAAAGAVVGNVLGESTASTVIGAGVGAAAGAIIDHKTK